MTGAVQGVISRLSPIASVESIAKFEGVGASVADHVLANPPTMDDVATAAGVSRTSVSRVFLGQKKVSAETIRRVREVATRLGYVPNRIASGLASGKSRTIGVLVRDPSSPVEGLLLRHLQAEARRADLELIAMATAGDDGESTRASALESMIGLQVSGLVVTGNAVAGDELHSFRERLPIVRTGLAQLGDHTHSVWCDARDSGERLATHVAELAHTKIAVLAPAQTISYVGWLRTTAMVETLARLGIEPQVLADTADATSIAAALDLVEAGRVRVVMAPSDDRALDVLRAARERGLRVPGAFSVTGCGGVGPGMDVIGLTTMRLNILELARRVVDTLVQLLAGELDEQVHELVPGELVPGYTLRHA